MRDEGGFEPALGRPAARDSEPTRPFLARVLHAANVSRGSAPAPRGAVRRASPSPRSGGGHVPSRPARRVVIKVRIVRFRGHGRATTLTHLRYVARDGTGRTGERGGFYGPDGEANCHDFVARGAHDRHQFRLIVSAEDGAEYEDLEPLTRRLMAQAQIDLGTRLDWVAVDHFDTAHPHTHILLRGIDQRGGDLVIPRDYLAVGLRARAAELVELDLGPLCHLAEHVRMRHDMTAERVTALDRELVAEAGPDHIVTEQARTRAAQALRAGRLAKLEALGLARPVGAARWRLAPHFTDALQRLGERGDRIRMMQRAFAYAGAAHALADRLLYDPSAPGARPLIGRVLACGRESVDRGRNHLIVDAVDGRAHYVPIGPAGGEGEPQPVAGATVRIAPSMPPGRPAEITILAARPLAELCTLDGATWLDREIAATAPTPLRASGFGLEVRRALVARRAWLAEQALLADPRARGPSDLVETLRMRDLARTGAAMSRELGLAYSPSSDGDQVVGVCRRRVTLASGDFALIERAQDFTLVPWHPEMERARGRAIRAERAGERTLWSLGRARAGPSRSM